MNVTDSQARSWGFPDARSLCAVCEELTSLGLATKQTDADGSFVFTITDFGKMLADELPKESA